MRYAPLLISLPVADRVRAHAFYRDALGLEAIGDELADDGIPEPLMFVVNPATLLMLIPTVGFGWVIGTNEAAPAGISESVLGIAVATEAEVEEIIARAQTAGAAIASEPTPQPWGYAAAFADLDGHIWTVTAASLPAVSD